MNNNSNNTHNLDTIQINAYSNRKKIVWINKTKMFIFTKAKKNSDRN